MDSWISRCKSHFFLNGERLSRPADGHKLGAVVVESLATANKDTANNAIKENRILSIDGFAYL
jgi:hypothetical protein